MSDLSYVAAAGAPEAIGPYSQAVRHGDVLYCSGQLPLDPAGGRLVEGSLAEATRRCLANLEAICTEEGTDLSRALQITIYTTRLERFAEINDAYADFLADRRLPARVTVGVAALPLGAEVELSAVVAV